MRIKQELVYRFIHGKKPPRFVFFEGVSITRSGVV